jgi:Tol biopolymer transport system component
MNKKTTIIVLIVIVVLLIIAGVFWYYLRKPASERPGIISMFFPAPREVSPEEAPKEEVGPREEGAEGKTIKIESGRVLTQLTQSAISGAAFASTTVRYVERKTGHIYEINPDGKNRKRILNNTILRTFESFWSPDANKLIVRYFEDPTFKYSPLLNVRTISLNLLRAGDATSSTGVLFPQEVEAVAVSPTEDKVFYLFTANEETRGQIVDFENKRIKEIFTSPFGEFNVFWPKADTVFLLTKPSAGVEGYLYVINTQSGAFSKVLNQIRGLTALVSPDASRVLYSESGLSGIKLNIFDTKSKNTSGFDLITLPEKCVWSKYNKDIIFCAVSDYRVSGIFPDDWYKGLVLFSDSLWQKNLVNGETIVLMPGLGLDAINLQLNQDESYLIFTSKADNTLWSLKLK